MKWHIVNGFTKENQGGKGMSVSGISNQYDQYYTAPASSSAKEAEKTQKDQKGQSNAKGATVEISGDGKKAYEESRKAEGTVTKKDKYATAKMSQEDRAAVVKKLQAEADQRNASMIDMVKKMLGQQTAYATGDNSIWRFLAGGNFTVDAQTKLDAQQAISEDGYYGVKKTSERLFEMAQALAGDDEGKMKEMQEAIKKGFKQATAAWGRDLPSICQDTMSAVDDLFDGYYSSKASS